LNSWLGTAAVVLLACASSAGAWRQPDEDIYANAIGGVGTDVVIGGSLSYGYPRNMAVARLDGTTGTEVWRQEIDGIGGYDDATDLAVDGAGDVLVGGELGQNFALLKLAGGSGAEAWRYMGGPGLTYAVALAGGGDGVGAGINYINYAFTVVRVDGATGTEVWRTELDAGLAYAVIVDAAGDVIAAGSFEEPTPCCGNDFVVVKLAGATGAELWRRQIAGVGTYSNYAYSVAADALGDVVAAGELDTGSYLSDFTVAKLAGTTGAEVWRTQISGTAASDPDLPGSVALSAVTTATGDVVAGGYLSNATTGSDLAVVRLDGDTGAEVWRNEIDGTQTPPAVHLYQYDQARVVAMDGNGDVIAFGNLAEDGNPGVGDPVVVKMAGATGDTLWRQGFVDMGSGPSGVLDASGDVFFTGSYYAFGLSGLDGAVGTAAGRSLVVKDVAGKPSARTVRILAADGALVSAAPGGPGDPTLSGAILRVVNPTTLETATVPLPAVEWESSGVGGSMGWRYTDPLGSSGPCSSVRVARGRFKATCNARYAAIPFSLDEATQGTLAVSLQLGSAVPQCAVFGGTVRRDAGTANPGPAGVFKAVKADAASGACP